MTNTASIDGGVMAAVLTPLNADMAPDHGRWLDHCRNLLEQDVPGLPSSGPPARQIPSACQKG